MIANDLVQFLEHPTVARDAVVALVGLCVGSFLNVLALRSLQENISPWYLFYPPSECTKCKHRLGLADLVPVVSYFALGGKCRYCGEKISWQYPFVEVLTAVSFVVILRFYGATFEAAGMLVFACTLIAICITDFRERLIPHEITYPSMVAGIIYSAMCSNMSDWGANHRMAHDVLGSFVGIAISYMLFDFIAFYGGWYHNWRHRNDNQEDDVAAQEIEASIDPNFGTAFPVLANGEFEEQVEVMGGGDAVLGAVIAAWLGISRFGVVLFVGFLAGALLGAIYLIVELKRANALSECVKPCLAWTLALLCAFESVVGVFAYVTQQPFSSTPWLIYGMLGIVFGIILGIVRAGVKYSKPFPFGPALAAGAVVAMFYDPFTLSGPGA